MVKSQKLWREIHLQYAKLREDDLGSDIFPAPVSPTSENARPLFYRDWTKKSEIHCVSHGFTAFSSAKTSEHDAFEIGLGFPELGNGFEEKHWVLTCCSLVVLCEWLDRSVLSIAMESMKPDFNLTDVQAGPKGGGK